MVDSVVSSREIYEDNAGDFPCFKAIFDMLGEVQHLGSTRFTGAEASLLRYQDVFDNGRQAVRYQALIQFVEVTREIGLKLFGLDGSFPGFRRATTRACLQSLGKRCVLAHALSRFSTHCVVTGPKLLISSVRISSSPAAFPFFRCFNEVCSSMIVKSSSKSWFSWPHRLILLCRCLFRTLPFRMS